MVKLFIRHTTTYHYSSPVSLGPHRLMLRPRESRELRIVSAHLHVDPLASLAWAQDVAGNIVATASFGALTDRLLVHSSVELELDADEWPVYAIDAPVLHYPFYYSHDELADLGALAAPQYADTQSQLRAWVVKFVRSDPTDTLALLKDINAGIRGWISYQSRDAEGTQSPAHTLQRGWGTCRDLAVLFIEAVRTLGFGARIVSGYLHDVAQQLPATPATGAMHAWAEVYVPGAGWIPFDPTHGRCGGAHLVPCAVGRHIGQVMPLTGDFYGPGIVSDMTVDVQVSAGPAG